MADWFVLYMLAFARSWGFFAMLPQFGDLDMPNGVKFALVAAITPFLIVGNTTGHFQHEIDIMLLLLLGKEVLLGLFMGFLVGLPLRLPQILGDIIENQTGTVVNSQYNPALGEESAVMGNLITLSLITYFFVSDGFTVLIGVLSSSIAIQPVTDFSFNFGDNFYQVAMSIVSNYMHLFVVMALPVMAVLFIVDLSLGTASKFASSLNVFTLAQPIKAVAAASMIMMMHPKIMDKCMQFFEETARVFS